MRDFLNSDKTGILNNRFILFGTFIFTVLLLASCGGNKQAEENNGEDSIESVESAEEITEVSPEDNYPLGVKALIAAYPDFITGYENGEVIFTDGSRMIYDDGKEKGFTEMLDNSSLKDMFYTAYNGPDKEPEYLNDAGRSRNEALFKKMYGNSQGQVSGNLVKVDWFGQSLPFTSVNGAAEQLKKAAAELAQHPEFKKYMKSAGTFYWRNVRGANRLSAHSYGIAIDLGVDNSDYWLWKYPNAGEEGKIQYYNRFPKEVAHIMEKYGFIWGGGWYHFDTMHFEYRPEILEYAKLSNKQQP